MHVLCISSFSVTDNRISYLQEIKSTVTNLKIVEWDCMQNCTGRQYHTYSKRLCVVFFVPVKLVLAAPIEIKLFVHLSRLNCLLFNIYACKK